MHVFAKITLLEFLKSFIIKLIDLRSFQNHVLCQTINFILGVIEFPKKYLLPDQTSRYDAVLKI